MVKLLNHLFGRWPKHQAVIRDVLVFYHDNRRAEVSWGHRGLTDDLIELPKGLADRADRAMRLGGQLKRFLKQHPPTIELQRDLDDDRLRAIAHERYPAEHTYLWREDFHFGAFVLAIIGLRQKPRRMSSR